MTEEWEAVEPMSWTVKELEALARNFWDKAEEARVRAVALPQSENDRDWELNAANLQIAEVVEGIIVILRAIEDGGDDKIVPSPE